MALDALAPRIMRHRNGSSAFRAGALQLNVLYDCEYDGAVVRVLNAGGWMSQPDFDVVYPLGSGILMWNDTDPNTQLPVGVTATFTQVSHTGTPPRGLAIGASFAVGSFQGVASVAVPVHTHNFSGTTGDNNTGVVVESGSPSGVATSPHQHAFAGTTGNQNQAISIAMTPFAAIVRLWVRTA